MLALAGIPEAKLIAALQKSFQVYEDALTANITKDHIFNGQVVHTEIGIDHRARMLAADRITELALGKDKGEDGGSGGKVQVEVVIKPMASGEPKVKVIDVTPTKVD